MKKILALALTVLLLAAVIVPSFSVTAYGFEIQTDDGERFNAQLASESQLLGSEIDDYEVFKAYLREHLGNCETTIDISSFKISIDDTSALRSCLFYDMVEAFHLSGGYSYDYYSSTRCIANLYVSYSMTKAEYTAALAECDEVTESFIGDLRNNSSLTEAEKALLVHDRIGQWCQYDYQNLLDDTIPDSSYEMTGALIDGIAVCEGYSKAYKYALEKIGIECYLCDSEVMCHEWNIVVIDGEKYHVDVTWDDPVWDVFGRVNHDNFLRSTGGIIETGHDGGDFDTSPVSTTYDSYYWQNSYTEFQYKNGALYYFDSVNKQLKKIVNGTDTVLKTISDKWRTSGGYYSKSYVRLDSDNLGNYLFYSTPESVYKYDITSGTESVYYTPDKPGSYYWIYGFKAQEGYFYLNIYNNANLSNAAYANNIKYKYEKPYTVSFYPAETAEPYTKEVYFGEKLGTLPVPQSRTGYIFDGWFTALQNGTVVTENTVLTDTDALSFYAHWHHDGFVVNDSGAYTVDTDKKIIYGNGILSATAATLSACFENKNISVDFGERERMATGVKIQLVDDCGEVYDTVTAVVFGDVNGDGWYDGTDAVIVNCIVCGLLNETTVGSAAYAAADCDHDGAVTELDVQLLEYAGVLLSSVDQSKSGGGFSADSAYADYLSIISQSVIAEADAETEAPENTAEMNVFRQILEFIIKLLNTVLKFFENRF